MSETVVLQAVPQITDQIAALQTEFNDYYAIMKDWSDGDLGEAFQRLSAYSARASEIRGRLNRSNTKQAQTFRSKQIEPFIEECDRQFRILSRIQSIRQFEWDTSKGGM